MFDGCSCRLKVHTVLEGNHDIGVQVEEDDVWSWLDSDTKCRCLMEVVCCKVSNDSSLMVNLIQCLLVNVGLTVCPAAGWRLLINAGVLLSTRHATDRR